LWIFLDSFLLGFLQNCCESYWTVARKQLWILLDSFFLDYCGSYWTVFPGPLWILLDSFSWTLVDPTGKFLLDCCGFY
jgi:hypothetical protein